MHRLSIILPSYNHNAFLKERLQSILKQTFTSWKLIIIDDNSTDGSIETLKKFSNKYPNKVERLIINTKNSGSGYKSWERGIELATTEYIWIAETDDYSDKNFLELLIKSLDENKKMALAFSASFYVNVDKEILYTSEKRTISLNTPQNTYCVFEGNILVESLPLNPLITNASSVVFRNPLKALPRELFIYKQSSDIFLWTYLVHKKKFIFFNKKLNYFRRHFQSTTTNFFSHNIKSVYIEKIEFINYFQLRNRNINFLKSYIRHVVFQNKSEWNKTHFLKRLNHNFILPMYYLLLFKFIINKILNKILKKI